MTLDLPPRHFVSIKEIAEERDSLRSSVHELEETVSSLESERNALNIQNAKLLAACEAVVNRWAPRPARTFAGTQVMECPVCYANRGLRTHSIRHMDDCVVGIAIKAIASTKPQGAG